MRPALTFCLLVSAALASWIVAALLGGAEWVLVWVTGS
jgi:hypothetical protein